MEFLQVCAEHGGGVAGGIAGDEDGEERGSLGVGSGGEGGGKDFGRGGGVDEVDYFGDFVEFIGADVGAVGEAEVDLLYRLQSVWSSSDKP